MSLWYLFSLGEMKRPCVISVRFFVFYFFIFYDDEDYDTDFMTVEGDA